MARTEKAVDQTVEGAAKVESTTAQPQAPGLDLNDLAMILNLLNISIKRGTFEPSELRPVLDSYEKLEAFLKFQAQMQAAAKAQQGDA
jgi:hypothetical protein